VRSSSIQKLIPGVSFLAADAVWRFFALRTSLFTYPYPVDTKYSKKNSNIAMLRGKKIDFSSLLTVISLALIKTRKIEKKK
jgi:hypothetical protein